MAYAVYMPTWAMSHRKPNGESPVYEFIIWLQETTKSIRNLQEPIHRHSMRGNSRTRAGDHGRPLVGPRARKRCMWHAFHIQERAMFHRKSNGKNPMQNAIT
eukprot:4236288-Pyramimonas_sp.AAC.1